MIVKQKIDKNHGPDETHIHVRKTFKLAAAITTTTTMPLIATNTQNAPCKVIV